MSPGRPVATVAAVVRRDDRFLVVEEQADNGIVFNQPAGHIEAGETPFEAVRREVLEETGWEFEPEAVVGIYLYPNRAVGVTYLRLCYAGRCTVHHPERPLDDGILRACWMSRAELAAQPSRLRSPLVLQCIDDFLAGSVHPLHLIRNARSGAT